MNTYQVDFFTAIDCRSDIRTVSHLICSIDVQLIRSVIACRLQLANFNIITNNVWTLNENSESRQYYYSINGAECPSMIFMKLLWP